MGAWETLQHDGTKGDDALAMAQRRTEQIDAIDDLERTFGGAGIDYWLFGGWAVDFWAGRVTRDHDDIDAAAWRRDYDRIEIALVAAGWRHTPVEAEVVGTRYSWRSSELELTFVEQRDDGSIVIPIPGHGIVWTTEPFGDERRTLAGVTARVIPLELLRLGKRQPRAGAREAAKDLADMAALDGK